MLSLKGNQGRLHQDVKLFFETENSRPTSAHEAFDGGHGRIESRAVRASTKNDWLKAQYPYWAGLKNIVAVTAKRQFKGKANQKSRKKRVTLSAASTRPTLNCWGKSSALIGVSETSRTGFWTARSMKTFAAIASAIAQPIWRSSVIWR